MKFLKADAPEYTELATGDKIALRYLVKAADILEKINMQLDCKHNLAVKAFLEEEAKKGNKQAQLTKKLFDAEDLSKEEFHTVLIRMIKDGKIDEVKNILTQRSVVVRAAEDLAGIDYIDYFNEDFSKMADELEKAAKVSTNADFNEYLLLQAKALRTADPMLDAYADKKWATLQDTPLEFTITRENYEDEMTGSAGHFLKDNKVDGVITITAFGCGPDSLMVERITRRAKQFNKPLLNLTIDEQTGEAGFVTRIEAFVDMLFRKKRANIVNKLNIKSSESEYTPNTEFIETKSVKG